MTLDLIIKQSYHGTGGSNGYKYEISNSVENIVGTIKDLPLEVTYRSVVKIDNFLYKVISIYDSEEPADKGNEVIFYGLQKFEFKNYFELGKINKNNE